MRWTVVSHAFCFAVSLHAPLAASLAFPAVVQCDVFALVPVLILSPHHSNVASLCRFTRF